MFKKIVSSLPFNPSLISHLRDYDLRLKQSLKLRIRTVLILVLVFVVQIIVILIPPKSSDQYSPNNLLNNTSGSINQLFNYCLSNTDQYQLILNFYNINCSLLYYGKKISLDLNSSNDNLFSLNKLSYDSQKETTITISGKSFYIRPLLFGNKLSSKSISVWELNINTQTYYLDLASGNIISSKQGLINNQKQQICSPEQLNACFTYSLSVRNINSSNIDANNTTVSSGNSLVYTLSVTNHSAYKITNFKININLQNALAYSNLVNTYGGSNQNGIVSYKINSVIPGQTQTEILTTKIKSRIPDNSISANDPNYFAQKMITSFGNSVVVFVPKTFSKFYEININNYLPSASSGDSLIIIGLIIMASSYLLIRTTVLRQEIKIIRHSHLSSKERLEK
jgi:hypothetical protein